MKKISALILAVIIAALAAGCTPDTKPADTTTAPEITQATVADDTATDSGCSGAISLVGITLVAALGTCTAFVAKKKED